MNVFDIISTGFARHVLGNELSGDPIRDSMRSLMMSHPLKKGTTSRLTGWAIFRSSRSTVQADLAAAGLEAGDGRTRFEAFAHELRRLDEPAAFVTFAKTLIQPEHLFMTVEPRITRVCSPQGEEVFDASGYLVDLASDFADLPSFAGVAEKNIRKVLLKLRIEEEKNAA